MSDHKHGKSGDEDIVSALIAGEMMNEQEPLAWWEEFKKDHLGFASEVHRRAYNNTIANGNLSPVERFIDTINLISFVAEALRLAREREDHTAASEDVVNPIDGDGGEDRPL